MNFSLKTSIVKNIKNSKPHNALILCHGFGGNKKSSILLANYWKNFLPNTIIYCPEAPIKCKKLKDCYQWFDPKDNDEKILKSTISSETKLNLFIDQVIKKNNLRSNKIFLVGFSQGGMISLQAAIRRKSKLKLVISYSGKIINREYLKNNMASKPEIFLFHGDKDDVIDIKFLTQAKCFLQKNSLNVTSKIFKNCDHKIPSEGVKLGLEILKENM